MYANPGLAAHEKLYLYRRRQGFDHTKMSKDINKRLKSLKVTPDQVQDWETGDVPFDPVLVLPYQPHAISATEWCIITRWRAGLSTNRVAALMKVDGRVVRSIEAEEADATPLVKFWEKRAYKAQQRHARANA